MYFVVSIDLNRGHILWKECAGNVFSKIKSLNQLFYFAIVVILSQLWCSTSTWTANLPSVVVAEVIVVIFNQDYPELFYTQTS